MLADLAKDFGIVLDEKKISLFEEYKRLVLLANEKMNLTAITDSEEIDVKHFLDSLSLAKSGLIKDGVRLIDVGTGAGFPAIPLKIAYPEICVVMLDSLNKRVSFLNDVIKSLGLTNISAYHMRAEEGGRKEEFREQFDIATARAVANLATLSEYCLPFVKVGGYFVAMKGANIDEEIEGAKPAFDILGGKLQDVIDIKLKLREETINHTLVLIKKIQPTLAKYPRKPPLATNKPLGKQDLK